MQSRKDIISNIVHKLYSEDLLNEADCPDYEVLCFTVGEIIENELANYIIIAGNIL